MNKLKRIREAAGMSQSQFATAAGISVRTLQDYEQSRRDINAAAAITVYKFCKILNCRIEDILNIEE